jgi:hypothetical protein
MVQERMEDYMVAAVVLEMMILQEVEVLALGVLS